jgi:outer membrane protein assembly factor BamD
MKKIFIPFIVLLFVFACSSKKDAIKKTPLFEAEAIFKQVNDKIKKGSYEDARKILEGIKAQDTSGKYATLAQIRIGDTYFKEKLYDEAAIEYEYFLKMHPYHKYASYAQYQLAMSYFKRIKTIDVSYSQVQRALKEFEKLLRLYPRNPYINIVESRIKMCKSILAEYEFYVGKFYFKKGSYGAAAGRFNNMLQNYPYSKKESESLYYLGLSYKNIGERDKSLKALTTLIKKYPTTKLSKKAKEIIASFEEQKPD